MIKMEVWLQSFIQKEFQAKDLENCQYFLVIEVSKPRKEIFLCQEEQVFEILLETGMLNSPDADSTRIPMKVKKIYV